MDSFKKENKDLKEKVNSLQIELTEKEVSESALERARGFLYGSVSTFRSISIN